MGRPTVILKAFIVSAMTKFHSFSSNEGGGLSMSQARPVLSLDGCGSGRDYWRASTGDISALAGVAEAQ